MSFRPFMKRLSIILGSLALLAALWLWSEWMQPLPSSPSPGASTAATEPAVTTTGPPGQTATLIGETILRDYAKPSGRPEHDLDLMAQLMDNFLLLVKSAATRPLSANEDWAAALRGWNPAQERFLPDQHAALNARGQLVDRWGTPLFFHALGSGRFEIRSAGPDRKLWTADDIHRNSDGSFRNGAELTERIESRL
jgi:hypothetical protein